MNLTDEEVLNHIKSSVLPDIEKKFRDGMAKYSAPLIEKDCLAEAIPEGFDLVIYLAAAQLQKARAYALVLEARARTQDLYPSACNKIWDELLSLLGYKPLAVPKCEEATKFHISPIPKPKYGDTAIKLTNNGTHECIFVGDNWESLEHVPPIVRQQIKEGKVFWNHKTSTWQYIK